MPVTLTRQQLYDLVWSEAMRTLATRIGISDVAIAKHCRKSGIPVPERGYWNKVQAGMKVTQAELPPGDLGTINVITMQGELDAGLLAGIKGKPGVLEDESIELLTERFRKRLGKVAAPRNFARVHPAIATLLRKDEQYRQERTTNPYSWHQPRFDNGIFLAVAGVGGDAWVRGDHAREIGIRIGDHGVMFELEHTGARSRPGYTPTPPKDEKTAKLRLTLGAHYAPSRSGPIWEDKDGCPLEDQLADIVIGLAIDAEHSHRQWVAEQIVWQQKRKEEEERKAREKKEAEERREREKLAAIERAKTNALVRDAMNWRKATEIRKYVEAVRNALTGPREGFEACSAWSAWALSEADKLDPIISGGASAFTDTFSEAFPPAREQNSGQPDLTD
jgi:hypothetical protein